MQKKNREESEEKIDSVFESPGLESEVTISILNGFCSINDHISFYYLPDAKGEIEYIEENQNSESVISIGLPYEPTIQNLIQVTKHIDTTVYGKATSGYTESLGDTFCNMGQYIFAVANDRGKLKEDPTIETACISLVKLGKTLQKETFSEDEIKGFLAEAKYEDPSFDFEIWFFLGGRQSDTYERLFNSFCKSKERANETKMEREVLKAKIVDIGSQINFASTFEGKPGLDTLIEERNRLEAELSRSLIGPNIEDFEKYMRSKRKLLEDFVLGYIGGQRSVEGLVKSITESTQVDMQRAIWDRGMNIAVQNLKQDNHLTKEHRRLRAILKTNPEDNDSIAAIQALDEQISSLPSLMEALELPSRVGELLEFRKKYKTGEISLAELSLKEETWLNSLHKVFKIPYDETNSAYETPIQLKNARTLKCRYQATVHGYVLMHLFPTYTVNYPTHRTSLVEKSDGTYTMFDNSNWPIQHIPSTRVTPFQIRNLLRESKHGMYMTEPLELEESHRKTQAIRYFVEDLLEDAWVHTRSASNTTFTSQFFDTRGNISESLGKPRMSRNFSKSYNSNDYYQVVISQRHLLDEISIVALLRHAHSICPLNIERVAIATDLAKYLPPEKAKTLIEETAQTFLDKMIINGGPSMHITHALEAYKRVASLAEQRVLKNRLLAIAAKTQKSESPYWNAQFGNAVHIIQEQL